MLIPRVLEQVPRARARGTPAVACTPYDRAPYGRSHIGPWPHRAMTWGSGTVLLYQGKEPGALWTYAHCMVCPALLQSRNTGLSVL